MTFREERMSGEFTKFHLEGPWPFAPVLHRFTAPDVGGPHDHPWDFTSHVLHGSYVEEIYQLRDGELILAAVVPRLPGTAHHVKAEHIHKIIDLPNGECWTLVIAGPARRAWRQWEG